MAGALATALLLAACEAEPDSPVPTPGTSVDAVAVQDAVAGVESLDGDFRCAEPRPRRDDYAWICEGSREPVTATIHLYAVEVDAPIFGVTLHTSAPSSTDEADAADATQSLAADLIAVTVPEAWREPATAWVTDRLPDGGGRTLDVPDAGITAAVQPLAAAQWYVELYELDGLER